MTGRTALITGVAGQDGTYLAELLLGKGYRVVGLRGVRAGDSSSDGAWVPAGVEVVRADLLDVRQLQRLLEQYAPHELYNFAARASSSQLFADPVLTGQVNGLVPVCLLEAIATVDRSIRFCQASSSEMFGNAVDSPQNEHTPFRPRNAYGAAKLYAHWSTVTYREAHGLFACSSILYNHESPRRGAGYVTRKIALAAARIKRGLQQSLSLGDLDARRDWGYAGDYVEAMWRMLQAPAAGDYVVATGEAHSVREFVELAFARVQLDYRDHVVQDAASVRPREALPLVGDAGKARATLGWRPSHSFAALVQMMVDADLQASNEEIEN